MYVKCLTSKVCYPSPIYLTSLIAKSAGSLPFRLIPAGLVTYYIQVDSVVTYRLSSSISLGWALEGPPPFM